VPQFIQKHHGRPPHILIGQKSHTLGLPTSPAAGLGNRVDFLAADETSGVRSACFNVVDGEIRVVTGDNVGKRDALLN